MIETRPKAYNVTLEPIQCLWQQIANRAEMDSNEDS